jgi:hypothetical protein
MKFNYSVVEQDNKTFVDVERAGRFQLNPGEKPADKAKDVIVATQSVDANDVEVQEVDSLEGGVITSERAPHKRKK